MHAEWTPKMRRWAQPPGPWTLDGPVPVQQGLQDPQPGILGPFDTIEFESPHCGFDAFRFAGGDKKPWKD